MPENSHMSPSDERPGHGEDVNARIQTFDWSHTPLGPLETWPDSLKSAVMSSLNASCPWPPQTTEDILRHQNTVLMELAKVATAESQSWAQILHRVVEVSGKTLNVERSSIWLYNDDRSAIHCVDLYERQRNLHSQGLELKLKQYPQYFKALEQERVIAAHNARTDSHTKEFTATYLEPLNIFSMLDAPIRWRGKMVGVICHEHVGGVRYWNFEEQQFAASVADIVGLAMETVERRTAETALRLSESRKTAILSAALDAIITIDHEGTVINCNPAVEKIFGYSWRDLIGQPIADFIIPERLRRQHCEGLARYRATGDGPVLGKRVEMPALHADGHEFPVELSIMRVAGMEPPSFTATLRDISERKRAEEALRESEERFRTLADSAPVLIWVSDEKNCGTYFNRRWLEFTGRTIDEEIGFGWTEAVHPDDRAGAAEFCQRHFEKHQEFRMEFRLRRADGVYRWMHDHGVPRYTADGTFLGYIGSCFDIHDRKEAERRYRQLNETLEEIVKQRTAKLEEQTWHLKRLAKELTETEQRERESLAEVLHDHVQQLIVASKMRLDMLGRKQPNLSEELEKVNSFMEEALASCRSLSAELRPPVLYESGLAPALKFLARKMQEQHDLAVNLEMDYDVPVEDDFIKTMLYQSVRELLLNVVKHAQVKECSLSMFLNDQGFLCIAVKDRGIGFNPLLVKDADRISFGLFSIQERIQAIGGQFQMTSGIGRGSSFELHVPWQTAASGILESEREVAKEDKSVPKRGREGRPAAVRLLLVDDHRIVREGIRLLLNESEYIEVVSEAENGEEAVEKAEALSPDVVLMDVNMPIMNGIEATRVLHSRMPGIKIIGLSVQRERETVEAMLSAGASAFFEKDGNTAELIRVIQTVAGSH